MINLIPPTAQQQVKREYWIRVITVWLLLLGVATSIAIVLYIPTYVLIQSQLISYTEEFEQINTENEAFTDARTALTDSNAKANILGKEEAYPAFTYIMEELEGISTAGIELTTYSFIVKEGVLSDIEIGGVASTRSALTGFTQSLEDDARFSEVDLPLSQLAQDRDIEFTLTLTWSNE